MDYKKIIDSKSFWKHVKPLFTEKSARSNKITLVEDNFILKNNDKIAETFNNFFTSQKQPFRGVPGKRCSEYMQQIYRRILMPKCDFNKATLLKPHFGMGVLP